MEPTGRGDRMGEESGFRHRRFPRYLTRDPAEVTARERQLRLSGILCDLSQEGCRLQLDGYLPPRTSVEVRCTISGDALHFRGETVWVNALGGLLHGVSIHSFVSEADAALHRLYLDRLARKTSPSSPAPA